MGCIPSLQRVTLKIQKASTMCGHIGASSCWMIAQDYLFMLTLSGWHQNDQAIDVGNHETHGSCIFLIFFFSCGSGRSPNSTACKWCVCLMLLPILSSHLYPWVMTDECTVREHNIRFVIELGLTQGYLIAFGRTFTEVHPQLRHHHQHCIDSK